MAAQQEVTGHVDPYIQALGLAMNLDEMELDIGPALDEIKEAVDLAINDTPKDYRGYDDRGYWEVWVETSAEVCAWFKDGRVALTKTKSNPGEGAIRLFYTVIGIHGAGVDGFDMEISSGYIEAGCRVEHFGVTTNLVKQSEDQMADLRGALADSIKSSAGAVLAKKLSGPN